MRKKQRVLEELAPGSERSRRFNVENDDPAELSECGNFESLFRGFREFIYDLVMPRDQVRELFEGPNGNCEALFSSAYWPVAFDMYFCDSLLNAMFGPAATQHAPPGSYPGYFRELFERGLTAEGGWNNRYLHHVLLGHYLDRDGARPAFLDLPVPAYRFTWFEGLIDDIDDFGAFDFVGLSNIFDWTPDEEVARVAARMTAELQPGATVLYRQLNNVRDFESMFGAEMVFDVGEGRELHRMDRSLFYSSHHVGSRK